MPCLSKYCFLSDVIGGHVLVYNSISDKYYVLNESEHNYIINIENVGICSDSNLLDSLYKEGVLVDLNKNYFDEQKYRKKIELMRTFMENVFVFNIIIDNLSDLRSKISDISFTQCIKAIKHYFDCSMSSKIKLILSYIHLDERIYKHLNILEQLLSEINYTVEITCFKKLDSITNRIIETLYNKGIKFNFAKDRDHANTFDPQRDILSYENYLSLKSMHQYFNIINANSIFSKGINPFDLLCPYLMENYYFVEHGFLIKKCPYRTLDQNNIVGIIDENRIIFNQNKNNFVLSEKRLDEDCKQCRFVYLCIGQNCKICNNRNVITCMPMKKIVNRKLNEVLRMHLLEEASE